MAQSTDAPAFRTIDWGALVRARWGDAWSQREVAYEWSNGRKFEDSGEDGGPYEQA